MTVGFAGYGWYSINWYRHAGYVPGGCSALGHRRAPDDRLWEWIEMRRRWFTSCLVHSDDPKLLLRVPAQGEWTDYYGNISDVRPRFVDVDKCITLLPPGYDDLREYRYGFPFRCLRVVYVSAVGRRDANPDRIVAGTDIGWRNEGYTDQGLLPSGPIWGGLVADVGIFTGAWLLVFELCLLPRRSMERRRAWRNRCVSCGYDRRGIAIGAPCPECGELPGGYLS